MKSSMLKESRLCWKSDFIAEPSILRLTIQNGASTNLEQLRWGRKEHHNHLRQSNHWGFPSGGQRAFKSPPTQRCFNVIPWKEAHSCRVFLPPWQYPRWSLTLAHSDVSWWASSCLVWLSPIGTTTTDPSRHVSNKHRIQHLHQVYSKWVFLYITSFPEGEYHLW